MNVAAFTALVVGLGSLITAVATLLRARAERRNVDVQEDSLDKRALNTAVQTVETIYHKVFDDMGQRIEDLLASHRECEAELTTMRLTARAQGHQISELEARLATVEGRSA